jgi:hypothetical protein
MEKQVFERQIFKIQDRVFDALYGWGEVINCDGYGSFPVIVYFDKGNKSWYTLDGRVYLESNPTLSFTEYTLEGFSQERQIKFPCTGMFNETAFGILLIIFLLILLVMLLNFIM